MYILVLLHINTQKELSMSKFRRLVKALVNPVAAYYKNDIFCCEIDEIDELPRDEAIEFIAANKGPGTEFFDHAEMSEEEFFKNDIMGCDGYWGLVPVRLMTTDFILSVLKDCPLAVEILPLQFLIGNTDVLNYVKNNVENNSSFKETYDWLIEKGLLQKEEYFRAKHNRLIKKGFLK